MKMKWCIAYHYVLYYWVNLIYRITIPPASQSLPTGGDSFAVNLYSSFNHGGGGGTGAGGAGDGAFGRKLTGGEVLDSEIIAEKLVAHESVSNPEPVVSLQGNESEYILIFHVIFRL